MELMKVLILGIVISMLAVFLKQVKPEYALLTVILGSVILLMYIIGSLTTVFDFFDGIVSKSGLSREILVTMLKLIGIGYLVEFSAGICKDSGNESIASKVVFAGKLMIFLVSMPIISNLFNMVLDLVS